MFLFISASSDDNKEEIIKPELKAKPAILKMIAAMGDNSSIVLKDITVHEKEKLGDFAKGWHKMKITGPGSRNYCLKMAWMEDRKRAFFCGANHGSPTRFNDAWEYDLASNTWVMLYVPDYNDRDKITEYDKKVLVLKDGWLRTKKGGPAHPAHTWWGLTYDPNLKAAVWYCAWPGYRLKEKLDAIGAKKEDLYKGPPMWLFYTKTKKWEPMKTAKPWPKTNAYAASLEYIPELKGSLFQFRKQNFLLDVNTKSWKNMSGTVGLPPESILCYDTSRKIIIAHRGPVKKNNPRTWHMSVKDGKIGSWEKVAEDKNLPNGHDARSFMYFDSIGKVAILYEKTTNLIWVYHPDTKKWEKMVPKGAPSPFIEKKNRSIGYYDVARNVFVIIGHKAVWCYRYKKSNRT
ncbi:MAG: hypothetical protein COA79_17730 [Planctomycetota bacterium]|nr:MAG: hypothetical protein COA79_17730 [Planctomycetota bacterium]